MLTSTRPLSFRNTNKYKDAFTWGDCGYLAVALSNATGLDVATASFDTRNSWVHAGVWIDEHHVLDITGVYNYQDWLANWEWANNGYGYEEYFASRWKAHEFAPVVMEAKRAYPEIDLDEAVYAVMNNVDVSWLVPSVISL